MDAARSGAPVLTPSVKLVSEGGWPGLGMELAEAGVGAIFAFPCGSGRSRSAPWTCTATRRASSAPAAASALHTVERASGLLLAVTAQHSTAFRRR